MKNLVIMLFAMLIGLTFACKKKDVTPDAPKGGGGGNGGGGTDTTTELYDTLNMSSLIGTKWVYIGKYTQNTPNYDFIDADTIVNNSVLEINANTLKFGGVLHNKFIIHTLQPTFCQGKEYTFIGVEYENFGIVRCQYWGLQTEDYSGYFDCEYFNTNIIKDTNHLLMNISGDNDFDAFEALLFERIP